MRLQRAMLALLITAPIITVPAFAQIGRLQVELPVTGAPAVFAPAPSALTPLAPPISLSPALSATPLLAAPVAPSPASIAAMPALAARSGGALAASAAAASAAPSSSDAGEIFDGSAPAPRATRPQAALARIFQEHPALDAALEIRVRTSPYAAAIPVDSWKRDLPAIMKPLLAVRAKELALSADSYFDFLAADGENASVERIGIAAALSGHSRHATEGRTAFFRDYPIWKAPLEKYLDGLVAARKTERTLNLQSVGAAYGVEAYALAISAEQALRRAGQDPAAWTVTVGAYDLSFMSLVAASRGLFILEAADEPIMRGLGLEGYFEPAEGGLLRLKAPMRDWIKPAYVNLDDSRLHGVVTQAPADVVFANYTLYHLRFQAAAALADHWLGGSWTKHGFLSIAHLLLAEVGASSLPRAQLTGVGLLRRFEANVGTDGRQRFGDDPRSYVRLTDFWRRARYGAARGALSRGEAFAQSLAKDPFFGGETDPAAVAFLRTLARERGIDVVLTTEKITARGDAKTRTLLLNAGWALAGGDGIKTLQAIVARETRPMGAAPEGASGSVTGLAAEGAALKLDDAAGRPVLRWLDSKVVPITDDYRSHNAARPDPPPAPPAPQSPEEKAAFERTGMSRDSLVRGLY